MKKLGVLLLCLCSVSCDAQYAAPVNIAYEVYAGCIKGFLQSGDYPKDDDGIRELIGSLDQQCINWTAVWTPTLIQRKAFLTEDEGKRLDVRRLSLLNKLNDELHQYAKMK